MTYPTGTLQAIQDELTTLEKVETDKLSRSDLVTFGQHLWRIINKAEGIIETIKTRLRQEASGAAAKFESEDKDSRATVTPQSPTVEVLKDANMVAVKAALGTEFYVYFEETTVYKPRKDFRERVLKMDPKDQSLLLNVVKVTPRTAKVGFKD